ncbi:MAG: transporter substrate-binding domain-containing protein [Bacteroidetes bacterium]|nr:transporter substrate-binding domain-containing protein [Bacteroidota bacterium]
MYRLFKFFLFFVLIFLTSCENVQTTKENDKVSDLQKIKNRGKLIALTDNNSTSYFIYRGKPMGYQYDLLKMFADYIGVDLQIITSNNMNDTFDKLKDEKSDLLALNLTVTKERSNIVDFTESHSTTRQVLVQRKPDGWENMSQRELRNHLIRNQLDLAKKTVYVQANTSYSSRLKHLSEEIGDSINIVQVDKETEQLIYSVANGEIEYTVTDENVALLNQTFLPNIDVRTPVSFPQKLAWAVRKNSPELLSAINNWINSIKHTPMYAVVYRKYFINKKATRRLKSDYLSVNGGKISIYDNYIKEYSSHIDWDWRLLASLIYQESRFNPKIRSWAGAYGLMQLMPHTATRFGANQNSSPKKNIEAGVKFIKWLNKYLADTIVDENQRIKFILASYNVGLGHVLDARRLAKKNGKNPNIWDNNVDYYILNKSNPKYYRDSVVRYGYCRGQEPYNYVNEIINRYKDYQNVMD